MLRHHKYITRIAGLVIGMAAIYFSLKNVSGSGIRDALGKMSWQWLIPIIAGNFIVIAIKALRWQAILRPVKPLKFSLIYRVLTIGFMANNILPARLGEAVRIQLLGKDGFISRITTTATLVSDRIIESVSFLIIAAIFTIVADVPKWMHTGLIITLFVTLVIYAVAAIYTKRALKNRHLLKFQEGVKPLGDPRIIGIALFFSFLSWLIQGAFIFMIQSAFGVHLPVWGIVLVLIAVNLAIALPSAPSHIGTFEFACILAYSYLGVEKDVALLLAVTYHLLQVIPVTLAGGLMTLQGYAFRKKPEPRELGAPG